MLPSYLFFTYNPSTTEFELFACNTLVKAAILFLDNSYIHTILLALLVITGIKLAAITVR